jgi:ABC-type nitrate/sulfonate/bicarbonate transport system permease component
MHGYTFPQLGIENIISSHLFLLIILLIIGTFALSNWFFPNLMPGTFLKGFLIASAILIVWETLSFLNFLSPVLLPPPSKVFSDIVFLWSTGFLQPQIIATLYRLTYAFILALLSAVSLGILIGYFSGAFSYIESLVNAARVVPAPAWLPLAVLWFGIGHASAIFIIWLGCFFPIFLNTLTGISKAEPVQIETILTLGGNRYDVLKEVILPVSYHHILTGARIGLGIGWIVVVTAELVSVDIAAGLGWMIMDSRILLDTTTVLSGIIVIGVLGSTIDVSLKRCERFVQGWS